MNVLASTFIERATALVAGCWVLGLCDVALAWPLFPEGPSAPTPTVNDNRCATGRCLSGFILGPEGAVADGAVRLVSLTPDPCPCSDEESNMGGGGLPWCACPRAFANWTKRLESCAWPPTPLSRARSDERGQVSLPLLGGGNALEIEGTRGLKWMALPNTRNQVALELRPTALPQVTITLIDGRPASAVPGLKGGFLFEDGHCVPLVDNGASWAPAAPLPTGEDATLLVSAPDLGPVVLDWSDQGSQKLSVILRPLSTLSGACLKDPDKSGSGVAGASVTLEGPFHRMRTTADVSGRFSLQRVPASDAVLTCERRGKFISESSYDGTELSFVVNGEQERRREQGQNDCRGVKVVDNLGRPLEGADVTLWQGNPEKGRGISGQGWDTDKHGVVCNEELFDGGYVTVHAPPRVGGWCTAQRVLRLKPRNAGTGRRSLTRVVLNIRTIPRSSWRGRVLSPEKYPVAGATVRVGHATIGECTEHVADVVTTATDGTFTLPVIPASDYALEVRHKWYAERKFDVKVPGPPQDLVIDRGATWTGRVLDPDGAVIDSPSIYVRKPGEDLIGTIDVSATGFSLSVLPPGDFKLSITTEKHLTLGDRTLTMKVTIKPNEHRREDIRWPGGATISGQVVAGAGGRPVAGTRIQALRPGALEPANQRHPDEVNVYADRDGHFVFRHLTPGSWVLRVQNERKRVEMTVPTGTTDVRLVL